MVFIRHFIHLLLSAFVLTSYSLFAFSAVNLSPKDSLLSGYKKDLAGEVLVYHSCHPEAKTSLLIRCLNDQDYIEWETAPALVTKKNDTVEFCWIGGF